MKKNDIIIRFAGFIILCLFYAALSEFGVFFVILIIAIFIALSFFLAKQQNKSRIENERMLRREAALFKAKIFLKPYCDIWSNLTLSNKYCYIRLTNNKTIVCSDKTIPVGQNSRRFEITNSNVYDMDELWNMFCLHFNHTKTYDDLVIDCSIYKASIIETDVNSIPERNINNQKEKTKAKLDINNASEVEITALPGISIVISKKIIKKREEINGFKRIEDVFLFLKLKPHLETQLRELICVKPMQGSVNIEKYTERHLDL